MIYLASLPHFDTIKTIADKDPKLLYYICFKANSISFPIKRPLIDKQEDCKTIANISNVFEYTAPSERPTHIPDPSCKFTNYGSKISEILIKKGICAEMLKFFKKREIDGNGKEIYVERMTSKEEFAERFNEVFSFESDPTDLIKNKIKELEQKLYTNFPDSDYKICQEKYGCKYEFEYLLEDDVLKFSIKLKCSCSNQMTEKIPEDEIKAYEIRHYVCDCDNEFWISQDFYNFKTSKEFSS